MLPRARLVTLAQLPRAAAGPSPRPHLLVLRCSSTTSRRSGAVPALAASRGASVQAHRPRMASALTRRWLSEGAGGDKGKTATSAAEAAAEEEVVALQTMTTREKISAGFSLTFWGGLLTLGGVCFYFTVRELWPTGMSPNTAFDAAFAQLQKNHHVVGMCGEPMSAYGVDHGGHREGRRNFIQHRETKQPDGSKRLTFKFNLKGPFTSAVVFAECSDKMDMRKGEWVYLIVQCKRTGRVITVVDNRTALSVASTGKSQEERDAMAKLLGGGSKA